MSGSHTLTTFGPGAHGARGCFTNVAIQAPATMDCQVVAQLS
jgi:hypothetical protein